LFGSSGKYGLFVMRVRRVTLRKGTAAEAAEHAEGYTANAESEWSRRAAHGGGKVDPQQADTPLVMHLGKRLYLQQRALGKLEAKLMLARNAGDHERAAYLEKQIGIKTAFIVKLKDDYSTGRRV
jgi:hypothetical protein